LFYRELGFALEEIATIVNDPPTDAVEHLRRQRWMLTERIERLRAMVEAIDHKMEAQRMSVRLTPEERFEVFDNFRPKDPTGEAARRWGKTEAYRQSQCRSATYKKEDLQRLKAEGEEVETALCAAFTAGSAQDSDEAMASEAHRQHITRWFYDCSYDVHRGMTDMYVAHDRFRAYYEALAPGLVRFVREAATPTPTVPVLTTKPTLTDGERSAKDVCITGTLLCRCSRLLSPLAASWGSPHFLSRLPTTPRGVIHPATPNVGKGVLCEVSVCRDYAETSSSRIAAT